MSILCTALASDPEEPNLSYPILDTLHQLGSLPGGASLPHDRLFTSLRDRSVKEQFHALSLQPFNTVEQRSLVQANCFSLLFGIVSASSTRFLFMQSEQIIRIRLDYPHSLCFENIWPRRPKVRISSLRTTIWTTKSYTIPPSCCNAV